MSNTLFPELQALRIEISDEVRDAQFQTIVAALAHTPAVVETSMNRARAVWRKWAVSAAAITTALIPVAAVASESSVPGDLLYPIKLTVERIQLVFDSDIDAEHRVDELESLIGQDRPVEVIENHIAVTLDTLDATPIRTDLTDRVDDAIDRFREADRVPASTDTPPPDEPEPIRDPEVDRTTTTTTVDDPPDDVSDRTEPTEARDDTTTTAPTSDQPDSTTTTDAARDGSGDGGDAGDGEGADRGDEGSDAP